MGAFSKGGVHKTDGLWWVIFKGGSTQNRWLLMGDFSKGGVHKTDGFWNVFLLLLKISAQGVYSANTVFYFYVEKTKRGSISKERHSTCTLMSMNKLIDTRDCTIYWGAWFQRLSIFWLLALGFFDSLDEFFFRVKVISCFVDKTWKPLPSRQQLLTERFFSAQLQRSSCAFAENVHDREPYREYRKVAVHRRSRKRLIAINVHWSTNLVGRTEPIRRRICPAAVQRFLINVHVLPIIQWENDIH